jgi:hypothetical protein
MAEIHEPREQTVRKLFALSGNRCAFPGCTTSIVDAVTTTIVGDVCHIRASSPGGPRHLTTQTAEERHGLGNLVLMCRNHHKIIDARENLDEYTEEHLFRIKAQHEEWARANNASGPTLSDSMVQRLIDTMLPSYSVHMDMRGATFNAGGQGGQFGGSGGAGGVMVFQGITAQALRGRLNLDGGDGALPGGGGGGGGTAAFVGRPATDVDYEQGLRMWSLLLANGAESKNGLLSVQGGAWEYYEVATIPGHVAGALAGVIDLGRLPLNTLIAATVEIASPSKSIVFRRDIDIAVYDVRRPVMLRHIVENVSFEAQEAGVYSVVLQSGSSELARLSLDVRLKLAQ